MSNKVTYEYAIIRLVPKVEREEFINIGVILFSKRRKYLGIKYDINEQKIKILSPDTDPKKISQYLKAWEMVCEGHPQGSKIGLLDIALRFRWLVAKRSTILQSSPTHSGLCEFPEQTLERIFNQFVL